MSSIVESFNKINSNIEKLKPIQRVNIVAVSKTFSFDHIKPLLDYGHNHFGENKVQEAISKWRQIKKDRENLQLHMIGKLQSNKAKMQHYYLTIYILWTNKSLQIYCPILKMKMERISNILFK